MSTLIVEDAQDLAFLLDILAHSVSGQARLNRGIVRILTKPNEKSASDRTFWAEFADGDQEALGFNSFICPPSLRVYNMGFLRRVIDDQIQDFRRQSFANDPVIPCSMTGILIAWPQADVDHCTPHTFESIAESFAIQENLLWEAQWEVQPSPHRKGSWCTEFKDPSLTQRWKDFHRTHARLRILSKEAHRSLK